MSGDTDLIARLRKRYAPPEMPVVCRVCKKPTMEMGSAGGGRMTFYCKEAGSLADGDMRHWQASEETISTGDPDVIAILTTLEASDADTVRVLADKLEADMRRYLYDRTPERRITCLESYRAAMLTASHPKPEPVERIDCGNVGYCHAEGRCTRHDDPEPVETQAEAPSEAVIREALMEFAFQYEADGEHPHAVDIDEAVAVCTRFAPATRPPENKERAQVAYDATRSIGGLFWCELSKYEQYRLAAMIRFATDTQPVAGGGE